MLQMLLNGYNYGILYEIWKLCVLFIKKLFTDDWSSIFGDPTKFGLGLFSVLFDILFMVQHYGLYRLVWYYAFKFTNKIFDTNYILH